MLSLSSLLPFLSPLVGGALIGLAIAILLLLNGRVAGISGVLAGLTQAEPGERAWSGVFLAGLLAGGVLARVVCRAAARAATAFAA